MRHSDVKVGNCYNIFFTDRAAGESLRECEFDGNHLGVVLKKNNDDKTVIVVPLTSQNNGDRYNKENIGKINTLPSNLKDSDSYIVYNQVRTVNVSRVKHLKDTVSGKKVTLDSFVNPSAMDKIYKLCSFELVKSKSYEEKEQLHYRMFLESRVLRIIDLLYQYKSEKAKSADSEDVKNLEMEISTLHMTGLPYSDLYSPRNISDGIPVLLDDILSGSVAK